MWFIVSKKRHSQVLHEWGIMERELRNEIEQLGSTVAEQQGNITAKNTMLKSTEREQVLLDLQDALNMVQGYQRSLSSVSAADPQIVRANALLEKYGMKGDPNASYLGFQGHPNLPTHDTVVDLDEAVLENRSLYGTGETLEEYIEREEKVWGDESYGSGTVRVEAEAIDEGDDKEDGFTRARITYYDCADDTPNE